MSLTAECIAMLIWSHCALKELRYSLFSEGVNLFISEVFTVKKVLSLVDKN